MYERETEVKFTSKWQVTNKKDFEKGKKITTKVDRGRGNYEK